MQLGWVNNNFVPFSPADPADLDPLLAPYHEGLWGGDTKAMNSDCTLLVSPGGGQVRIVNLLDNSALVTWNGANGEPTRPDAFDFTNVPAWSPA